MDSEDAQRDVSPHRPPQDALTAEALALEEADAWFEYLDATRAAGTGRYDEVETWAWARLRQRLSVVDERRSRLRPAAA